ncbi:MAG: hypothetical protein FWE63_04185 [Bacteroidales bacterium]|nr:hypothetical protein [Bacteroidales bacterium]
MKKKSILLFAIAVIAVITAACDDKGNPPGIAEISGNNTNIEPDETVTLTASASGATSYIWKIDNVEIPNATSFEYIAFKTGSYTVAGVNKYGTGGWSKPHPVWISCPGSHYPPTISGDSINACPDEFVTLTVSYPCTMLSTWYVWQKGIETLSETSNTLEVTETGVYRVKGVSDIGETNWSDRFTVTITSCVPSGQYLLKVTKCE